MYIIVKTRILPFVFNKTYICPSSSVTHRNLTIFDCGHSVVVLKVSKFIM